MPYLVAAVVSIVALLVVGGLWLFDGPSSSDAASFSNPGLEQLDSTGTVPMGWWRAGYGSNRATWSFAKYPHNGRIAQRIDITSYVSGDRKLLTSWSDGGLAVTVGHRYALSSWYHTTGTAEIVVFRRTTNGSWSYWTSSSPLARGSVWRRASFTTPPVPSGTTGLSFGIAIASNGTLVTDDYSFADLTTPTTTTTTTSTSTTTTSTSTTTTSPNAETLVIDRFDRPDGLVTNEYAFWNPTEPDRRDDPIWELNSGSLFATGGLGWTGVPDDVEPNALSSNGTNSTIFRLLTKRSDLTDFDVSFRLRPEGFVTTPSTPAVGWDGVHVFLRYASETSLYYASFDLRDGLTQIKKKIPDGPSNDGVYYTLGEQRFPFTQWTWQSVRATIETRADRSVAIALWVDGVLVCSAVDTGIGGPTIPAGRTGIRGDNLQFSFDDFVVTALP